MFLDGLVDIQLNESKADISSGPVSDKKSQKATRKLRREPILQRKDSLEKVMKVIDSISFTKPQPSTSHQRNESLPKDKLILNSETLLILNLLGMSSEEREKYLIDVAKQRKLLLTNSKTNTFNVNPDLFDVNNVPQVVDFVHQFHGKPIPTDMETTTNATRKIKQKVKKKEKEKKPVRTMVFENQSMNIVEEVNRPEITSERSKRSSSDRGCVQTTTIIPSVSHKQQKPNKNAAADKAKAMKSLKGSTGSSSMSHLNKIVEKPTKKPRTLSACEQAVSRVLRQVDAHRQSVDEEFSKRQQKRLRQKLRAMSLECTLQANAEKPPTRKRGSRGSKKVADPLKNEHLQTSTPTLSKTDVAAKNLIRSKCSQINVKIQEKLNLCSSSSKAGPSTSAIQSDDLVIESIDRVDQSDEEDNESSSVISDSSNFPDEETTSYFAKSDDMESSCNEKKVKSVKATGPNERSMAKEDIPAVSST